MRGEAERLPFTSEEFDHLTFTYLLRYVEDPPATMAELARVVKPGGHIASLEFAVPPQSSLASLCGGTLHACGTTSARLSRLSASGHTLDAS